MQGLLLSQLQQWAAASQSHEETLGNGTKHKTQNYPHPKSKGAGKTGNWQIFANWQKSFVED